MSAAAFEVLAPLFRYPGTGFAEAVADARELVPEIEPFAREVLAIDPAALEATYTATFDLAPTCSPYLGIHVFGDDARRRARLMLGLQRSGSPSELPDHIAEVLAHRALFEEEEWHELEQLVLLPALMKMALLLGADSPYRLLVEAVLAQLRGGCPLQVRTAASDGDRQLATPRQSATPVAAHRNRHQGGPS